MADQAQTDTDSSTRSDSRNLYYRVLLAVRGSTSLCQDPSRPPIGMPGDVVVKAGSVRDASTLVEEFLRRTGANRDNWAGGDVWYGNTHMGRIHHDGRYVSGETGPVASTARDPLPPAPNAQDALRELLDQLERAGVYRAGAVFGLTPDTAKVDFRRAEHAAGITAATQGR